MAARQAPVNGVRPWRHRRSKRCRRRWRGLPGLGPRSARRAVLHLMKRRETALEPLLAALQHVARQALDLLDLRQCRHVRPVRASAATRAATSKMLCVVEEVADLWALDRSRLFPGRYHVLGGRLSALGGRAARGPRHRPARPARFGGRDRRGRAGDERHARRPDDRALSCRAARDFPIRLSQLAHGLPVGGELDYLDEGTLAQALRARRPIA